MSKAFDNKVKLNENLATVDGVETLTNKVLTSPDINGGAVDNAVIGGTTPAAGSFTTLTTTANVGIGTSLSTSRVVQVLAPSGTVTGTTQIGVFGGLITDATATSAYGIRSFVSADTAAVTVGYGYSILNPSTANGGSFTNWYNYQSPNITGTYTGNVAGFFGAMVAGTNRYNLYITGTADNYLAGNLGVGVAPTARNNTTLQVVDGLGFPATQVASSDANTLDDYEEGTFTPAITGTGTAGTGTYSVQLGRYTKIGNRVLFNLNLNWSAHTGSGNMIITGLPFTAFSATGNSQGVAIGYFENITLTAANIPLGRVQTNTSQIALVQIPSGGGANAAVALDTAGVISISGEYEV